MKPLSLAKTALMLAAALGSGCSRPSESTAMPSPPPAQTTRAETATIFPSVAAAGVIVPFLEVGISSSLSEPITEVAVRPGMHVRRGDLLAQIDTGDLTAQMSAAEGIIAEDRSRLAQTEFSAQSALAQARGNVEGALASLRQAQATLEGAQRDAARESSLARQGYLAIQTLDQQQTVVAADQQAVLAAQTTLREAQINAAASGVSSQTGAQQAEISAARQAVSAAEASATQIARAIARATLIAPIDGVVESVNANVGEYPAGRELFTIEQIDRVYASLPTSSRQSAAIRRGQPATVAVADNPASFRGTVDAVLDQIEPGTTSFVVRVLLDNQLGALRPGMAVNANVALTPVRGERIPLTAFTDDERRSVLTVDGSDVVHEQSVFAKAVDQNSAVVAGIPSGTRVIADVQTAGVSSGDRLSR